MGGAGGGRGIRTPETVSRLHTFQACAFNHSATPPVRPHGKAREGAFVQLSVAQGSDAHSPPRSSSDQFIDRADQECQILRAR